MQKAKIGTILLTAALISGAVPITALADTEITSISLDISSDIVPGDDNNNVDVSSNSSRYDVDDVEVTNEPAAIGMREMNPESGLLWKRTMIIIFPLIFPKTM